jgi:hypothetical protein
MYVLICTLQLHIVALATHCPSNAASAVCSADKTPQSAHMAPSDRFETVTCSSDMANLGCSMCCEVLLTNIKFNVILNESIDGRDDLQHDAP